MRIFVRYVDDEVVEGMVRAAEDGKVGDKFFSITEGESMFGLPFKLLKDNGVGEYESAKGGEL